MQLIQKLRDDQKCMKKVEPSSRSKAIEYIISIGSFVEALVLNHFVLVRKIFTHKVAKELWERIQMLMQGTSLTEQEREYKLYDEFDKFTYRKGKSLRDFYLRFSLLLNDMNMYNMKHEQFQMEYAPTVHQQSEFLSPKTGLAVLVFQKGFDPIDTINQTRDEKSFDPIPQNPESSKDDGNGVEDIALNLGEEEEHVEEEEEDELYRDVNINLGRGLQATLEVEDTHVTLTLVKPDGQQESSSMSS
nr:hypothetical protein [Tanacetum cinerariifolium]